MSSNPAEHILIITVDQAISFLLEQVLRSAGYEVVTTRESDSTEELIHTSSPALVILSEPLDGDADLDRAIRLRERFPEEKVSFHIRTLRGLGYRMEVSA